MLYRTHRLTHPQCIFISSFITHVIHVSYDTQCTFFVVVKLSSPCYTMLCNVIIWCSVKCVYMHEYMEEGRHSVTDNSVIWLYMWNSTHRIRLTCTLKQKVTLEGSSEPILHFATPLYEIIFIKNDLWYHAVLSTKGIQQELEWSYVSLKTIVHFLTTNVN